MAEGESAYLNQEGNYARTFIRLYKDRPQIAAYFALTCAHIPIHNNKDSIIFDPPRVLPCVYLARLAVDKRAQKQSLGKSLLLLAMGKALLAAENVGIALFITEPLEGVEGFYEKYEFRSMGLTNGKTIAYRSLKDIRAMFGGT